mgnify:CR=1 FL=1
MNLAKLNQKPCKIILFLSFCYDFFLLLYLRGLFFTSTIKNLYAKELYKIHNQNHNYLQIDARPKKEFENCVGVMQ